MIVAVIVRLESRRLRTPVAEHGKTNEDGRRVTLVFTMAESVSQRVDPIAAQLVNEFKFEPMAKKIASKKLEGSETK